MKTKIPLYLAVLLFSIFFLTGCTSKESITISDGMVKEAEGYYENREYKKAIEKFSEALETYPANVDAYKGLNNIFLDKGYLDEAEKLANEASLRVSKENAAEIYTLVGDGYYEVKDIDNAKEMYQSALEKEKSFEKAQVGLAGVYIQKGEVDKAVKTLKGGKKDAEYALLYSYLTLDDWEKGLEAIGRVDLNDVKDEGLKQKVTDLREVYAIDDEDALYKNTSLAGEYINSGYPFLAVKLLTSYSDEIQDYADAQYFLGKAYLDYGDYEKAIERLNKAVLLDMDDVNVYVNLARAYLASKNVEKSLDAYKTALSVVETEEKEQVVKEYVAVLVENNMINAARTLVVDLLKEKASFAMNIILADIYYKQEALKNMGEILDQLEGETNLNQSETRGLVRYRLLYIMKDIRDVDEAESLIERFSTFDRYNPEVFLFRGKLFRYQEDNLKAREALERAIELDLEGEIAEEAIKLLATIN